MRSFLLLPLALLLPAAAAILEEHVQFMDLMVTSDADAGVLPLLTSSPHYENPGDGPCASDEKSILIMGIDGTYCAPACTTSLCPTDVPDGVTAVS
jgi:hypothetical protein